MSASLKKRSIWMLVAAAATLSLVSPVAFPERAEAQDASPAGQDYHEQEEGSANRDAADAPPWSAAATRPAAAASPERSGRSESRAVEPGDTLWSIGQERLGTGATSQQVGDEVGRIFELNRGRIGDDPGLILVGQELLLPSPPQGEVPVQEEAEAPREAKTQEGEETASAERTTGPVSLLPPNLPGDAVDEVAYVRAPVGYGEAAPVLRLLGLGLIALSLFLAVLTPWMLFTRRDPGRLVAPWAASAGTTGTSRASSVPGGGGRPGRSLPPDGRGGSRWRRRP